MTKFHFLLSLIVTALLACKSETTAPAQAPQEQKVVEQEKPVKVMTEATLDLGQYGISNDPANKLGGLKVGATAPDFTLKDQRGNDVNLYAMLKDKSVLLTFYRGHWCGYCSKQLASYTEGLSELRKAGAELVAISPETTVVNKSFTKDKAFDFPILSDDDHSASKDYMGYYKVSDKFVEKFSGKLLKWNNDTESQLNVPATYLIGKDHKIKYAYYDNDYSKRASLADVMAAM